MKKYTIVITVCFISALQCREEPKTDTDILKYPLSHKEDTVDIYFGKKVVDPYRWLEDENSPETKQWVEGQNKVTFSYLSKIPFRDKIKKRLTELYDYPRYSAPFIKGDYFFYFKNDGLQNQSVLYVQKGAEGEPEILLDPNTFSSDGTVALSEISVSHDYKYIAYSTASAGSDWEEAFVMDLSARKMLPDHIRWIKFSGISWHGDGFYYSRYDVDDEKRAFSLKNEYHKIYYHQLWTLQSEDQLIYEDRRFPLRNFYAETTDDERFLVISASEGTSGNMLMVKDLSNQQSKFITLINDFKNDHSVIDNIGDKLLVMTNFKAGNKKVVLIDPAKNNPENRKEVLPEKDEVLTGVDIIGNKLFALYMKDATSRITVNDMQGDFLSDVTLPGLGTVYGLSGNKNDTVMFFSFTSFTVPPAIYQYNTKTSFLKIFKSSEVKFNPGDYESKQVFYHSSDSTLIPMFIVHRKGLTLNGNNPLFLYGYGGFDISITPSFSISNILFMENGGIYAVANIRGGGEYGEKWHEAGTKLKKQNVFNDFIAAAEYLISENYTSSQKLAIHGRSNGGLLIGACMTQRPELFKVALPAVGVMDMLRFHKFTIGWAWTADYGSSADSVQFHNLLSFSPVHNIRDNIAYPATLITTADHDDRVVPAHSFKFAAALQEKHTGSAPVLIRIETRAGHGAGKPTSKIIEENADIWSFVFYNLGMKFKE